MEIIQIAGGVWLADISAELPRSKTRKYRKRNSKIERLYFHKSGRLGAPGIDGPRNSARYCVQNRGWPGMPYTFWLPFHPVMASKIIEWGLSKPGSHVDYIMPNSGVSNLEKTAVIFRCQPDEIASYHTGGLANQIGVAACFQGNSTVDGLSPNQIELAEALIPWAFERYGLELPAGLSWHSDTSGFGPPKKKPVCPGFPAVRWLERYRGSWIE